MESRWLKISRMRKSLKMMSSTYKKMRKMDNFKMIRMMKSSKRRLRERKMKMESGKVNKWRVINKKRKAGLKKEKSMMMQSSRGNNLRKKETSSQSMPVSFLFRSNRR